MRWWYLFARARLCWNIRHLVQIMSVYMSSSKNMSYDSAALTTSDIKWLGVRPSDLDKYNVRSWVHARMRNTRLAVADCRLQVAFSVLVRGI